MSEDEKQGAGPACPLPQPPDESHLEIVRLDPDPPPADYREAMRLAERVAEERLGEAMLIAWYDRDRDFESPQHASECHEASAVPGYVDYALSHGARLKVDVGSGRYVFYYVPVDL